MTNKSKIPVILFIVSLMMMGTVLSYGLNIKYSEKVPLLPGNEPLGKCMDFCITEDGLYIIPDQLAGNIKIYERNSTTLELIQVIGRKGFASDEFVEPALCFYNKEEGKLGVVDFGLRKIFVYDRIGRLEFKRPQTYSYGLYCLYLGTDIRLSDDKLLVAGNYPDPAGLPYDLYYIDLKNAETNLLMPSFYKFGFSSFDQYFKEYRDKDYLKMIGVAARFDTHEDNIFYVWEGKLNIINVNMTTHKVSNFGQETKHYIEPYVSDQLATSFKTTDVETYDKAKEQMSYVRDIFTTDEYLILIYDIPVRQIKEGNLRAQFYSYDGQLIKEMPIPGQADYRLFLDKDKKILYSLVDKKNIKKETNFYILTYIIQQ